MIHFFPGTKMWVGVINNVSKVNWLAIDEKITIQSFIS